MTLREVMRALPVGGGGGGLAGAVEQRRPRDRELGRARVEPIVLVATREIDERGDRRVELGCGVLAIGGCLRDLGEHRVRLGSGLAAGDGGAAEARAGVVGAPERDQRASQLQLVPRRDVLHEAESAEPLVELRGGRVIAACGGGTREPDERIRLEGVEVERAAPGVLGGIPGEQRAEGGPRTRARAVIAARLGEPSDLAPRLDRRRGIARREDRGRHLVHRRIVGRDHARGRELLLGAGWIAEPMHEHVGEPQPQLHRARRLRGDRARTHEAHELGPALLVGQAIDERVRSLGRAGIVLERELVELRRRLRVEHAQEARAGEGRERGLIVVPVRARELRELHQVTGGLAGVALRERDRGERGVRGRKARPSAERLARELDAVEEPRRPRRREREDPLEQQGLVRTVRGQQRAVATHRLLEVAVPQLMVDRVHEVVRRRELMRRWPHAELAAAGTRRPVSDLDRAAADLDRGELDRGHRRQAPATRRHQVPEQGADEIDLDIAQPAGVRSLDRARCVGGAEQRGQDAVRDHGARRRQVTVHTDRARERTQVRTRADELDPEAEIGGGEPVGGARPDGDEAVIDPRAELCDAEPGEVLADVLDPLVERGGRQPHGQGTQPRPLALEPLGDLRAGVRAELGDLELELLDHERADRQSHER